MGKTVSPDKLMPFSKQKEMFAKLVSQLEAVPKTKLLLVLVANTLDPVIGKGCREDIETVSHMCENVCNVMEFVFIQLIIADEDYGRENILEAINVLTPGPNDIVVFYYSGHGFSYEKDNERKYPQVDLRSQPASDKIDVIHAHTENLNDVFEAVKQRGARLNIVVGDCCNNLIEFERKYKAGVKRLRRYKREPFKINKKTAEALFCDHTASILVAAADKGEYAITDNKLGSIFTYNFSRNLKKLLKKNIKDQGIPWSKLLEETKSKTNELSKTYDIGGGVAGNQTSIFIIESSKTLY